MTYENFHPELNITPQQSTLVECLKAGVQVNFQSSGLASPAMFSIDPEDGEIAITGLHNLSKPDIGRLMDAEVKRCGFCVMVGEIRHVTGLKLEEVEKYKKLSEAERDRHPGVNQHVMVQLRDNKGRVIVWLARANHAARAVGLWSIKADSAIQPLEFDNF